MQWHGSMVELFGGAWALVEQRRVGEVGDLGGPARGVHEDVSWMNGTMDDVVGMDLADPQGDLDGECQRVLDAERPLLEQLGE